MASLLWDTNLQLFVTERAHAAQALIGWLIVAWTLFKNNKQTHTITRQTKSGRICQGQGGTKLNSQLNQGCGREGWGLCFHLTDCFSPWLLSGEQIRWATERERESRRESERNRVELISSPFVSTLCTYPINSKCLLPRWLTFEFTRLCHVREIHLVILDT